MQSIQYRSLLPTYDKLKLYYLCYLFQVKIIKPTGYVGPEQQPEAAVLSRDTVLQDRLNIINRSVNSTNTIPKSREVADEKLERIRRAISFSDDDIPRSTGIR